MKQYVRIVFAACILLIIISPTRQSLAQTQKNKKVPDAKTIGILIGGSLIGFDYEIRAS